MKNFKILFLVLIVSFFSACDKDFDEINTNPNNPEVVPATTLLVSGISKGVRRTHGASMNMTYAGLWSQHYAKMQYIDEDWYEYRPDAMATHWDGMYAGPLSDLQVIINTAPDPSNMKAAAMTMKAYYMAIMTDMWGDVPYSEALNIERVTNPRYDTQEEIYAGLIASLTAASAMFGQNDELGAGDIIYGGDIAKWKKFSNSILARLLNRAAHKNAAYATQLTALVNGAGLIGSNDENAFITYPDASVNSNPIWANKVLDGRNDHVVSKTLVDLMTDDPRLPVFAELADGGTYVGQPNGTIEPNPFTSVSQIGKAFRDDPAAPSFLMTYPEVLFIKAEATNSKQTYLDAIAASCGMHGVAANQAFLDAKAAEYDANPAAAVATQKWIALFGDGCEGFSEFRRTGYPASIVEVPRSGFPGKGVPRRFAYPTSEVATNKANLEAAVQRQAIDNSGIFGNKMWWAK